MRPEEQLALQWSGGSSCRAGSWCRVQELCFSACMQPLARLGILPKSPDTGLWLHTSLLRAHPTFATAVVSAHSLLSNILLAQPLYLRCLTPCPNDTLLSLPLNCIHDISEHASGTQVLCLLCFNSFPKIFIPPCKPRAQEVVCIYPSSAASYIYLWVFLILFSGAFSLSPLTFFL